MSTATSHVLSAAIRAHHHTLAQTLGTYTTEIEGGIASGGAASDLASLTAALDGLTGFLTGELLPHARGEERTLYPALDPIIATQGSPTATMRIDHEYLTASARQISETVRRVRAAAAHERPALLRQLGRQLIQFQGLFTVHLAKEERVYLPLIERAMAAGDQRALLAALHDEATGATADATVGVTAPGAETASGDASLEALDVRPLSPAQRHPVIFARFNALPVGSSFVLINDHDPKPLHYQLVAEYTGQLLWEYLESGPEVWRVRLGKAR